MKVRIFFSNSQKALKVTTELKALVRKAVRAALEYEKFAQNAEISVSFVSKDEIRALNKEYRGIDRETDVLSFPMLDGDADVGDTDMNSGAVELGDVIICGEVAVGQAETYGHTVEREVAFLAVHSTLHLLGYDHERSKEEEAEMFNKQEEILNVAGIPRGGKE